MTRQNLKWRLKEFTEEMLAGFMQAESKRMEDDVTDDETDWEFLNWSSRLDHFNKQVEQVKLSPSAKGFRDVAADAFLMWYYHEFVKRKQDAKAERLKKFREASGGKK